MITTRPALSVSQVPTWLSGAAAGSAAAAVTGVGTRQARRRDGRSDTGDHEAIPQRHAASLALERVLGNPEPGPPSVDNRGASGN